MKTLRSKMILLILVPAVAIGVITAFVLYFNIRNEMATTVGEMFLKAVDGHAEYFGEWISRDCQGSKDFC